MPPGGSDDLEAQLAELKEIKVKIPMELYLKLHQHKILHGALLQDVVAEALGEHLRELEREARD